MVFLACQAVPRPPKLVDLLLPVKRPDVPNLLEKLYHQVDSLLGLPFYLLVCHLGCCWMLQTYLFFSKIERLSFFEKALSWTHRWPADAIGCDERMAAKSKTCWHLKCCLSKKILLNFSIIIVNFNLAFFNRKQSSAVGGRPQSRQNFWLNSKQDTQIIFHFHKLNIVCLTC